jgi:orotidine-5'-phosphate decarboxylase
VSQPFGARLRRAMDQRGPLCVGIDPHPRLLADWGLSDDAAGLERFTMTCVEALSDAVAVLKPQSAFFERHGSRGIAVLELAVADARAAGALVLLDVKRGDIGSTMQGYADAYLDPTSPLAVDAVTVSPFLGFGSLRPMLDTARRHDGGVFVLVLTSNPEGAAVQRARTPPNVGGGSQATGAGCPTVASAVLASIAAENAGSAPLGSVGAVVGATLPEVAEDLHVNGPVLAPGFGAQGGAVADLRRIFTGVEHAVLPSTSRSVLEHGPDRRALREAAAGVARQLADFVA